MINLWVLIDNYGRIYYTGGTKMIVEMKKQDYIHIPNLQVIELKGELNHV